MACSAHADLYEMLSGRFKPELAVEGCDAGNFSRSNLCLLTNEIQCFLRQPVIAGLYCLQYGYYSPLLSSTLPDNLLYMFAVKINIYFSMQKR